MAPKSKPLEKGQRPISSFFCKKPVEKTRPTAIISQKPEQPDASTGADNPNADGQPPLKRQRTQESSLIGPHACTAPSPQPVPAQRTNGTAIASHVGVSAEVLQGCIPLATTSTRPQGAYAKGEPHAQAERPPASVRARGATAEDAAARHQRFQNKLVLGTGVGRRGGGAEDIVPQPRTPLEEQVYALKRKHPGMLLLIEVKLPAACYLCLCLMCSSSSIAASLHVPHEDPNG